MKDLGSVVKVIVKEKRDIYLSIVFGFLAGITAVGLFAANGYLISQAALQPPLYVLIAMVAVVKIGSIVRATSRYAERYYSHRATFTMLSDLRVFFYEKLEKLPPGVLSKYRSGDLLARIVGDVENLQNFFLRVVYPPILMFLVFLSTMLFVSFYSWQVVVLLFVGLLLTGFLIPILFAKKQRTISNHILEERAKFSTEVTEWFQGFRELTIHQNIEIKGEKLTDQYKGYINEQRKSNDQANLNHSINLATSFIIFWAVLGLGGYLVATSQLDGVLLAMIVMISLTVFDHSTPMATFPIYYEESERAAGRLHSVISEAKVTGDVVGEKLSFFNSAPSIEWKNVSVQFPEQFREVVSEVSLTIREGTKTAIVGASGSGKSTLLHVLLKLQETKSGEVCIDGVPIAEKGNDFIWSNSRVVLQENHFFYGTIKENLLLKEDLSDDEVQRVLKEVELHHFTPNDIVLEKGENLSGGEKQRLAGARAILKQGRLWLLDEPTSSLDSWTEQKLYDALLQYAKEDTVVIVSHRLTGLEKMDQIVVMEEGKVIEVGTFKELMDKKGYFYELKMLEMNVLEM
ncbi:thiol reductant ABC exporter subunit CydC [Bacillus alkalisoli]|uniref:thiol reductant ABC exporter subunit CydC n=1 Tax=Bacillus alkalisoli TaxID=2011008 RepID=UPI000C24E4E4|nr:thiol reductant ABC exporter subunit CydC [Bacillus alkalisoli]